MQPARINKIVSSIYIIKFNRVCLEFAEIFLLDSSRYLVSTSQTFVTFDIIQPDGKIIDIFFMTGRRMTGKSAVS